MTRPWRKPPAKKHQYTIRDTIRAAGRPRPVRGRLGADGGDTQPLDVEDHVHEYKRRSPPFVVPDSMHRPPRGALPNRWQ